MITFEINIWKTNCIFTVYKHGVMTFASFLSVYAFLCVGLHYIHIYIYVCVCVYLYIYICIFVSRWKKHAEIPHPVIYVTECGDFPVRFHLRFTSVSHQPVLCAIFHVYVLVGDHHLCE